MKFQEKKTPLIISPITACQEGCDASPLFLRHVHIAPFRSHSPLTHSLIECDGDSSFLGCWVGLTGTMLIKSNVDVHPQISAASSFNWSFFYESPDPTLLYCEAAAPHPSQVTILFTQLGIVCSKTVKSHTCLSGVGGDESEATRTVNVGHSSGSQKHNLRWILMSLCVCWVCK